VSWKRPICKPCKLEMKYTGLEDDGINVFRIYTCHECGEQELIIDELKTEVARS